MKAASVARAACFNVFLDELDNLSAPTERWMDEYALPQSMRFMPDAFLPNIQFANFLIDIERRTDMHGFAFDSVRRFGLTDMSLETQRAVFNAPTLFAALKEFQRTCVFENSLQQYWFVSGGPEFISVVSAPKLGSVRPFSNLLQNWAIVQIVRAFAGPDWLPDHFAMMCDPPGGDGFRDYYGNTRVLHRQKTSWITIPRAFLHLPPRSLPSPNTGCQGDCENPSIGFSTSVRLVIRSHIADGALDIDKIADSLAMSVRTLQRVLARSGTSFRKLLNEARCELARDLLQERGTSIIDVALAVGYEDASHFTRFFRGTTGVTPTQYRALN